MCINCLEDYVNDNQDGKGRVCNVSRELEFVRNPWESVDRKSSKSLKLRFMGIKTEKKKVESTPAAAQAQTDPAASTNSTKVSEPEEMYGVVGR